MLRNSILAGLCALALSAIQPARAQAPAPDRVLFQLDWLASGEHAAWYAGVGQGFFRQNGIDLSITRGYGSGDTVNKIAAGAAVFGVADLGGVLTARARQNMPVKDPITSLSLKGGRRWGGGGDTGQRSGQVRG